MGSSKSPKGRAASRGHLCEHQGSVGRAYEASCLADRPTPDKRFLCRPQTGGGQRIRKSQCGWKVALVACAAGLVALQPVQAGAASTARLAAGDQGSQLVLLSMLDGVSPDKSDLANLASTFRSDCTRKRAVLQNMDLSTALAHIETQLSDNASAKALQGFATSAQARSIVDASDFVIEAIAASKPWAAVDALLRVHQLDPRDAGVLISLSGLVTSLGMPQEGLALLGAAAKLPADKQTPMGIDYQAVALNNRGVALLELGYPGEAEGYLGSAESRAPLLSEARDNLDAAQQCAWLMGGGTGEPPVIADPPFWREDQPGDWTTDDDGDAVPVASSIFDLSQGVAWTPIHIELPGSPAQGEAMVKSGYYLSLANQIEAQVSRDALKKASLSSQVHDPNEQTSERRYALWAAHNTAQWQPELKPLYQEFDSLLDALGNALGSGPYGGTVNPFKPSTDALDQCSGSPDYDTCFTRVCTSETADEQSRWRTQEAAVVNAALDYQGPFWRYETGVAANDADSADHQLQIIDSEDMLLGITDEVVGQVQLFVNFADDNPQCTGTATAAPPEKGLPSQDASKACPSSLRGMKTSLSFLHILTLSFTCEEVELEVATGAVGAFASVSWKPDSGNVTVFAGAKAEVPAGAELGGKVGGYLTFGPNGLVDGGMRTETSIGAGSGEIGELGGASVSRTNTINFSIAGTTPFNPESD